MSYSYRFQVGDIQCMGIAEGERHTGRADVYFHNAPKEEVEKALAEAGLEDGALPSYFNILYLETGDKRVLVDAGFGPNPDPSLGRLLDVLGQHGIQAEDITTVIITHAHGDHISGLVTQDGELTFSNALHMMWRSEWEYWTSEEMLQSDRGEFLQAKLLPLQPQLALIASESELVTGVYALPAPGHTPGHMALLIESEGQSLLHIVDAAHQTLQLKYPQWSPQFDSEPDIAIQTRKQLFKRAADEGVRVLAYHFPFPGLGYIRDAGETWRWEPL